MDLCIKSKRGGKISVHFGKELTTNLWDDYGWYVIVNDRAKDLLGMFRTMWVETDQINHKNKIFEEFPTPSSIGYPYRRSSGAGGPACKVEIESKSFDEILNESSEVPAVEAPKEVEITPAFKKKAAKNLINFFSEFTFCPAIRFTNTLANCMAYSKATEYVNNYMDLCDHPDKNAISDKLKSDEFKMICEDLFKCASGNKVNNRLEIYYGPAGTGKTTDAIKTYPDAKVTVCNELMDSTDLMKTFSFNDENGHPVFKPSTLQEDMIAGRPHILDEINLLPLSTLRYLQGILDGKKQIEFEGKIIDIAEGFKIIGTMNLIVNGQVFNLPEPIVDRAEKLNKYDINENILADHAF